MSSIMLLSWKSYPFALEGWWEKHKGFQVREYEAYGDDYQEVSVNTYATEKDMRKAFSQKKYKLKKLL